MLVGIAPLLAGLGLFFCGIHFIATNLASLTGRRFRTILTGLAQSHLHAALIGIVAGAIMQSTNAVTYIVIGLVRGHIIGKRQAILIPTWSHVGASVLVIFVAIDLRIAASYIVALAGFSIYFGISRGDRGRQWTNILLGIGLLFLGMAMLKTGAEPLRDWLVEEGLVSYVAGLPVLLLLLGAGLTVLCQSSTVAGAIAVTASNIGMLDFLGAGWMVIGANLGSAANHYLLARGQDGEARQIALMQVLQKLAGFAAIVLLFVIGLAFRTPLVEAMASSVADGAAGQVAWLFLFYQIAGSLTCTLLFAPVVDFIERAAPPTQLEELSRPSFLIQEALVEPSLALDLVGNEEARLMERLPSMLDCVRDGGSLACAPATLRSAGLTITHAMVRYLESILDANPDRSERERVVRLQHRTANLSALYESLEEFVRAAESARAWPSSGRVIDQIVEALHYLLSALVDAVKSPDPAERQVVLSLLGNRDDMMEKIRQRVLSEDPDLPAPAQSSLFAATMLFERVVWLARQNTQLLSSQAVAN